MADEAQQFRIRGWFPELAICTRGIKLRFGNWTRFSYKESAATRKFAYSIASLESNRLDNGIRDLLDAYFFPFSNYGIGQSPRRQRGGGDICLPDRMSGSTSS